MQIPRLMRRGPRWKFICLTHVAGATGCHLCEGLEEKLKEAIAAKVLRIVEEIDVRDISTNTEWWSAYQLEVCFLFVPAVWSQGHTWDRR